MRYRGFVLLFGVLAAVLAVASVPTAGQAQVSVPKTPWGDPDLQGIWEGVGSVPFERPVKWAGREFKTDAEIAALEKTANAKNAERGKGTQENRGFRDQANYNAIFGYNPDYIRVPKRTSAIIDPPDGLLPPWTLEAVKRYEEREAVTAPRGDADWTVDRPPGERCISDFSVPNVDAWGMGIGSGETAVYGGDFEKVVLANPDVNPGGEGINPNKGFGGHRRVIQAPGFVVFVDEESNNYWVIPLDGRPHISKKFEQFQGDARGHFEGNTLVVEYTNVKSFGPVIPSYGSSIYPSGTETLKVTERYTRSGKDDIDYRYTVDDPSTYTRPYTVQFDLVRDDNYKISPVPCREGIDDIGTTLYGWRLDEDQAMQNADETRAARKPVFARIKKKALDAAKGQSR